MINLNICPSTLKEGFSTYCPVAVKSLFDGNKVSHIFPGTSPEDGGPADSIRNIGRISLSGAQPKFSVIIGENKQLRYTREGEQGTYILKPRPTGYQIANKDYCAANEHVTMQIASQFMGLRQQVTHFASLWMISQHILQDVLTFIMEANTSKRILLHCSAGVKTMVALTINMTK